MGDRPRHSAVRRAALGFVGALAALGALAPAAAGAGHTTAVIGGREAPPGAYPYMAFVVYSSGDVADVCSGTVVSSDVVLTAAHCVLDESFTAPRDPAGFAVVTGSVDWDSAAATVSEVDRVAVDPDFAYEAPGPTPVRADVAVLGLTAPVAAPPVRLAESKLWSAGTGVVLAGWGETEAGAGVPRTLHVGEASVQSDAYCGSRLTQFDPEQGLCILDSPQYRYAACHGDSGGPLLMPAPGAAGEPLEIGIASIGPPNCATTAPQYYTRADAVAAWVAEKVREWVPVAAPPPPPPATTPPAPRRSLPRLSRGRARAFALRVLRRARGVRLRRHRALRVSCRAVSASRRRCAVRWRAAGNAYRGHVAVYYAFAADGHAALRDRYAIVRLRRPCRHRRRCATRSFGE